MPSPPPHAGAARFVLSPSRLARFFFHECERNLRFLATRDKSAEGVPALAVEQSPVARAVLEGGYAWEEEVVAHHLNGRAHVAAPSSPRQPLHERVHSEAETVALLRSLPRGHALYQGTLEVPERFVTRFGLDPAVVSFSPCRPDLVWRDRDTGRLRIVDVKASQHLKASHRVQAALYEAILEEVVAEHQLDAEVDRERAGIWLHAASEPAWFALALTRDLVDTFLRTRVPSILGLPMERVGWHLHFRCEWCEYFTHCQTEANQSDSVSRLPFLSVAARDFLRRVTPEQPIHSLHDLRAFLARPDAPALLSQSGSLRGRARRLEAAARALHEGRIVLHGGSTPALPRGEHVRLVLTVQRDAASGRLYAAGFRRQKGTDVFGTGSQERVFVASSPEECGAMTRDFVEALHAELSTLHAYNAGRRWAGQKSLQTYVFDSYEERLFRELLHEAAADPSLAPKALPLLFHFQDETLAEADQQPRSEVPFPVVVLTSAVRELLALPAPTTVRLGDAVRLLQNPGFPTTYVPHGFFDFELSNALKSDAIFHAWRRDEPERSERIARLKQRIGVRLLVTGAVVDGLRHQVQPTLFTWAPKFVFPPAFAFRHPELASLAFVVQYERFVSALEARQARAKPLDERIASGTSVRLAHEGGDRWRVLDPVDEVRLSPGFFDRLLVREGDEGEVEQMAYDDHRFREQRRSPAGGVRLAYVKKEADVEADPDSGLVRHVTLSRPDEDPIPPPGVRAVLHPRFVDFTSRHVLDRLKAVDAEPAPPFVALLRAPSAFAAPLSLPGPLERELAHSAHRGFTEAQARAYHHLWRHALTLVWGPPGTGKTHFLSHAVVSLAEAHLATGVPIRIGVTAFTHVAIEHLLRGIARAARERQVPLAVQKLEKLGGHALDLEVLSLGEAAHPGASPAHAIGCTVYSLRKALQNGMPPFDVLVVDEGSQVRLSELALSMAGLARKGRLVLAGDDQQLPPIVRASYPEPSDGRAGLHASAFEYLRARDDGAQPFTCLLEENWRMNTTLSSLPARTIYGPAYRPATAEIARRALRLAPRTGPARAEHALLDWLLDPEWPLVVAILEEVAFSAENPVEAELVALAVRDLRARQRPSAGGDSYPRTPDGDRAFWRDGVFVVSPHHVQIRAIRRALGPDWRSRPFVDTVDKMQGQECDTVLVSYGVSDQETALAEAEFLYSRERLNVSTTRARAKCVAFLPRPLLEPRCELLENARSEAGLGHMHALLSYCREHGEAREFVVNWLRTAGTFRLTALRARRR